MLSVKKVDRVNLTPPNVFSRKKLTLNRANFLMRTCSRTRRTVGRAPHSASGGFSSPLKDLMRLAAWHVSGITYRSEEFLQGQPAMCSSHGVQGQKSSTQRLGNVFVAGVIGNREILFKQI